MVGAKYRAENYLAELRSQLAARIGAVAMAAVSVVFAWRLFGPESISYAELGVIGAVLGLGWGTRLLSRVRPALSRHLLAWGLAAGQMGLMVVLPAVWVPFLSLPLMFVIALLVSGGEFLTGAWVGALSYWLVQRGDRAYPLPELLGGLVICAALSRVAVQGLYTALDWAWMMHERADSLLEQARDHQGELGRTLHSFDKTNWILRRTQRELIAARREAEEARHMKEQFAANVSHELRTPLNLILGFSEMMHLAPEVYGDVDWPAMLRRDVYQIYRASRHLLQMVNDILDLSRFEMVGFTLSREPTAIDLLLQETVEIAQDLFRGRPVRLLTDIDPDLPTLEIDPTRIRQVLLNLLSNAARFTAEGVVRVAARRLDGEVTVSISDTGPGIPADELPHLFQEFYQVDRSLSRPQDGAGLGLAISKHFVEAHDGRIWAESEEGQGATFHFALPVPGHNVPVSYLYRERPPEIIHDRAKPSLVVVDPDPDVAALIRRHLEAYDVVHVRDAAALNEAVPLYHPQAVVRNTAPGRSPDWEGDIPASIPTIDCSLPSRAWAADDLALVACLTKPITTEDLASEIARLGRVRDILVVDDDRDFCQLVERMLGSMGQHLTVRRAYGGEDGLVALRARRPDLVLLDLAMPGMGGLQMLEIMRAEPELSDVHVVLLTATSYAEDALAQRGSRVLVDRPGGLSPIEVLHTLRAVIGVLRPHYDEHAILGSQIPT